MYRLTGLLIRLVFNWAGPCLRARLALLQVTVLGLLGVACAIAAPPAPTPSITITSRINVVATTTVLADMARSVGGDLVEVISIVPAGADAHAFQTTPSQSIAIGEAAVIVSNGFGLDSSLDPVLASAARPGTVRVVAAQGLDAQPLEEMALAEADGQEDEHGAGDPHFWLDPILAIHYVERIRDGLVLADPSNARVYSSNADGYIQEIRELDREIARVLSEVPPERRRLVTFHDAYGYFGRRYGWEVFAFVPSDASDVTPRAIERVISRIQSEGIPAIFAEPQFKSDVLEEAARDTGIKVGIIYSLPDSAVPTYVDLMRANARSLAENLR